MSNHMSSCVSRHLAEKANIHSPFIRVEPLNDLSGCAPTTAKFHFALVNNQHFPERKVAVSLFAHQETHIADKQAVRWH